jgi:hypothetical protein
MVQLFVVATLTEPCTIALAGPDGVQHTARVISSMPAVGDRFDGFKPEPGFALLLQQGTRQPCRVIFERLDSAATEQRSNEFRKPQAG